ARVADRRTQSVAKRAPLEDRDAFGRACRVDRHLERVQGGGRVPLVRGFGQSGVRGRYVLRSVQRRVAAQIVEVVVAQRQRRTVHEELVAVLHRRPVEGSEGGDN